MEQKQLLTIAAIFISIAVLSFGFFSMQAKPAGAGNPINTSNSTEVNNMPNATEDITPKEIAVFETTKGTIEIELDRKHAPATVANFIGYVQSGFYNGLVFHRVIQGFMIQGGGFDANGTQKETGAPIALESNNGLKNTAGTVAMARTNDPNSATAQFFINTVDNGFLNYAPGNPGYAVFGKVILGMETVKSIELVQTATRGYSSDWPVTDVVITRAYMKTY